MPYLARKCTRTSILDTYSNLPVDAVAAVAAVVCAGAADGGGDAMAKMSSFSLGFALQRANSHMLRNADRRWRKARSCGLYSSGTRPSSLSPDDDY